MAHALPVRSRDDVIFGNADIKKRKDPAPTAEIQAAMDRLDTLSKADDYKHVGNLCYGHGMFSAAIRYYTKATEAEPENHVHFSNRSAAYVNSSLLAGPSLALKDADRCIALAPQWFKGHLRRGDALFVQDKLPEAVRCYDQALALNPDCAVAATSRHECLKRQLVDGTYVPPEKAPYTEGAHGQDPRAAEPPKRPDQPPAPEDTESLIKAWNRDTCTRPDATATRRHKATTAEADRAAGQAARQAMMDSFRRRVASDDSLASTVRSSQEQEALKGAGFDYRASRSGPVYSKGTDDVGHAITADCHQSFTGAKPHW